MENNSLYFPEDASPVLRHWIHLISQWHRLAQADRGAASPGTTTPHMEIGRRVMSWVTPLAYCILSYLLTPAKLRQICHRLIVGSRPTTRMTLSTQGSISETGFP